MKKIALNFLFCCLLVSGAAQATSDMPEVLTEDIKNKLGMICTNRPLTLDSSIPDQLHVLDQRPQYFKDLAETQILIKTEPYTEDEMTISVKKIMDSHVFEIYTSGIDALFKSGQDPKHPPKSIRAGLVCLASKLSFANALLTEELYDNTVRQNLQMTAVRQLFELHKSLILRIKPGLEPFFTGNIDVCKYCVGLDDESDNED